jgi:exosome complex component MTR3
MPRRPARLSNCYVPLPLPSSADDSKADPATQSAIGVRQDRSNNELRQLFLETSVIGRALGSSLVELGHTKVLCEVHLSTSETVDMGSLDCVVKYAPHVGVSEAAQRGRAVSAPDNSSQSSTGRFTQDVVLRESSLSHQLSSALLPVLPLDRYPKCTLQVRVLVLQDDGSCLSAAITASTLALVDARVDLYDLVTSSTVAILYKPDNDDDDDGAVRYLADPTEEESFHAQAIICLAVTPNHKEVTLWSQTGRLPSSLANHAMELCRDGCRTMHKFMREVWLTKLN